MNHSNVYIVDKGDRSIILCSVNVDGREDVCVNRMPRQLSFLLKEVHFVFVCVCVFVRPNRECHAITILAFRCECDLFAFCLACARAHQRRILTS